MHDRQARYQTIEVHLRHAMEDARQMGDDFLAYLIEVALLETCMTTSQDPKSGGEARAREDC